jgi:hypothetical protein
VLTQRTFQAALRIAEEFFMGESQVQRALDQVTKTLDELGIPYAVAGAMALNGYGYQRVTVDVDLLLTREGLAAFKAARLGRGYSDTAWTSMFSSPETSRATASPSRSHFPTRAPLRP